MPTRTKAELLAENTRLAGRIASLERAKPQKSNEVSRARNVRSVFVVPMMRGNSAIGTISVSRKESGLFLAAEGVIE